MALLPIEEALARILDGVIHTGLEILPLHACSGRILGNDIFALRTQPPFDVSAMDGYAVRAADIEAAGGKLTVIGSVAAGAHHDGQLLAREAVRIFTGAPVPAGANSILIQENVEKSGATDIVATATVVEGQHIRRKGLDFCEGDIVLRKGRRLDPAALALAASCNHATLPVHVRPRIALLSTGNELCMPGETPGFNQIIASNAYGVGAIAREAGADTVDLGIVRDDLAALTQTIADALQQCDVLVTLGGASVGDHDLVQQALTENGVDMGFWKIAMRPGKPTMYGRKNSRVHVLGLPGNPVASLVCAHLFLAPLIGALCGSQTGRNRLRNAVLGTPMRANDLRQDYVRASLAERDGILTATPLGVQDSSMLSTMAAADCLILRAPFAAESGVGDACKIMLLHG